MKKTCLLIILLFVLFLFVGCGGGEEIPTEGQYQIYKLAQESGYTGSYEEWLESIKGENGTPVELVVERGMLYWKYAGDSKMQPLFDLYSLMGEQGQQGVQGDKGDKGDKGEQGEQGVQGEKGEQGEQGVQGEKGDKGEQGEQGVQGEKGEQGEQGVQGEKGDKGDKGEQGEQGNGIVSVEKTASPDSYTDIYTITFSDGSTFEFEVTNGKPLDESKYEVTFDSDGGSFVEKQEIQFGYKVDKPEDPTKDGYIFAGWYVGEEKWSFSSGLITQAVNLKAKWELANYSITYELNGGEEFEDAVLEYNIFSDDIILVSPSKKGYTFTGWYDNAELSGEAIEAIETGSFGDKTLYAAWEINTHKISFQSNGGTEYDDIEFTYQEEVALPVPTRSGYKFLFWSDSQNMLKAYEGAFSEDTDLTLYARWVVDGMSTYTVEVYLQDEDGTYSIKPYEVLTYEALAETFVEAPLNYYNGYEYPSVCPSGLVVGDGSLVLKAYYPIRTYDLYLDDQCYQYKYGETIGTIDEPIKEGYTFTGWNQEIPSTMPNRNLYINSTWQANVYKVSFDTNGSDLVVEDMNVIFNQTLYLPTPTIEGYEFDGWYFNGIRVEDVWTICSDATLKAHWSTKYTDFVFDLVDDYYELKAYIGNDTNVIVPSAVNGVAIKSIANEAFKDNDTIETLTIKENIYKIGDYAFKNMSALKELVVESKIDEFGAYILEDTNVEVIYFKNGYTKLFGFYDYVEGNIPSDIVIKMSFDEEYIYVLNGLKNLVNATYSVVLDDTFTYVPDSMFENCKTLTNVVLPNTIETIGYQAFSYCDLLNEINLPNGIKEIRGYAFSSCYQLENIDLPTSLNNLGYGVFQNTHIHSIVLPSGITEISDSVFWSCNNLSSIVLPNTIKRIGNGAFEYCYSLQNIFYSGNKNEFYSIEVGSGNSYIYTSSIEFNSQVTELEYVENDKYSYVIDGFNNIYDFIYYDIQITCFDFGEFEGYTIKSLRNNAFSSCRSLTHIVIPNTVALIGEYVFCDSIKKVFYLGSEEEFANIKVLNNNEYLYNSEIEYNTEVKTLEHLENDNYSYVIDNLNNIYEFKCKDNSIICFDFSEFEGCEIKSIGSHAFSYFDSLKYVIIPKTVERIDNGAFEYCNLLEKVFYSGSEEEFSKIIIEENNYSLQNAAIEYNSEVTDIEYVENDKYLYIVDNFNNIYEFKGKDNSIITFDFSEFDGYNIESISSYAFRDHYSLNYILIPKTVERIGYGAFESCNSIMKVFYSGSEEEFSKIIIEESNYLLLNAEIEYNSEVTDIEYVENDKYSYIVDNLNNIYEFKYKDNSITTFDFSEFEGYTIKSIGSYAFSDYDSLNYILIPKTVERIGYGAFESCDMLNKVFYSGSEEEFSQVKVNSNNYPFQKAKVGYNFYDTNIDYVQNDNCSYIVGNDNNIYEFTCKDNSIMTFDFSEFEEYTIKSLAANAFRNFTSLRCISIPKTVERIGNGAFQGCYSMIKAFYSGSEEEFSSIRVEENNSYFRNAEIVYNCEATNFEYVENDKYSYLVDNLNNIYEFKCNDNFIIALDFSEFEGYTIKSIASYAFRDYDFLQYIIIPKTVERIGNGAFESCDSIMQVFYSGSEEEFSKILIEENNYLLQNARVEYNFNGRDINYVQNDKYSYLVDNNNNIYDFACVDRSVQNFDFSELEGYTIKSLSAYAFSDCDNLTSISIPDTVYYVGEYAFAYCDCLERIFIPSSVEIIRECSFEHCNQLTIYCELESQPETWMGDWNWTEVPVIWGFVEE